MRVASERLFLINPTMDGDSDSCTRTSWGEASPVTAWSETMPLASNPEECDSPAPIYRLSMRKLNYIILSIVVLGRWFKMTNNVEQILQHLTHANPKLTYLIAIGETEQAQKAALTMLVEKMYSIYYNQYVYSKAEEMNKEIATLLPKIKKLGLEVPEYVTSGEKFIDYMNNLTDNTVPYKEEIQDPYSR